MSSYKPLDFTFVKFKIFVWSYCYNQHVCLKSKINLRKTYSITGFAPVVDPAAIGSDWKRAIVN